MARAGRHWEGQGRIIAACLITFALTACASVEKPGAVAASQAVQKVGKPYAIKGRTYTPAHQPNYNEVGEASWYGAAHQGRRTANGEVFDLRRLSAAHKTLPLPSLVEVTNLENGRSMPVRVNDRGPFVAGRIIDLSQAAAERLGFKAQGHARVRVRYLGPGMGEGRAAAGRGSPLATQPVQRSPKPNEGGWTVQAGAFADAGNAARAAGMLGAAGRTEVRPTKQAGRTLHRVLVGRWGGEGEAAAARSRIAALGFADARVVPAS